MPSLRPKIEVLKNYFTKNFDQRFCDWEWIAEPDSFFSENRLPDSSSDFVLPILIDNSESIVCIWEPHLKESTEHCFFVWIDSEGVPSQRFASTVDDFLSLLAFGSGGLYDMISNIGFFLQSPADYSDPSLIFNTENIASYREYCKQQYGSHYDQFIDFLIKEINIAPSDNPVAIIQKSMTEEPVFDVWIKQFG